MNVPVNSRSIDIPTEFQSCFDKQRAAYLAAPEPSYAQRITDLKSLTRLLKDNKDELVAAINADYGNRSEFETLFAEYFVVLETVADAVKHLKKWMKPQRRHVDFMTYPLARNRVIPQPLGVVGVIVPWNFPLNLSFCPLGWWVIAGCSGFGGACELDDDKQVH
jgi:coniferyl-aldehyde dehydrogenase